MTALHLSRTPHTRVSQCARLARSSATRRHSTFRGLHTHAGLARIRSFVCAPLQVAALERELSAAKQQQEELTVLHTEASKAKEAQDSEVKMLKSQVCALCVCTCVYDGWVS